MVIVTTESTIDKLKFRKIRNSRKKNKVPDYILEMKDDGSGDIILKMLKEYRRYKNKGLSCQK